MAEWNWYLQGTTNTEILGNPTDDVLQFAGGSFNAAITVDTYQTSMHVDAAGAGTTDNAAGDSPNNVKYISNTQGLWDTATEDITDLLTTEATLHILFTDASSVETSSAVFYAHQTATTDAPTSVSFWACEAGDGSWTGAEGSGSSLSLDDQATSTTDHDFYVAVSAAPNSIGSKSFTLRAELTYQ